MDLRAVGAQITCNFLVSAVGTGTGHTREERRPGDRNVMLAGEQRQLVMKQGRADGRLDDLCAGNLRSGDEAVDLDHVGKAARHRIAAIAVMGGRLRCGKADSPGLHRAAHDIGHGLDLVVIGSTFHGIRTHDIGTDRRMPGEDREIDGGAARLDRIHIFGETFEWPVVAKTACQRVIGHALHLFQRAHDVGAVVGPGRRDAETAIADDRRSDAMPGGDGQHPVPDHLRIVMGVDIDKPRRHRQAGGIDDLIGIFVNLSDGDNPPVRNADIADIAGRAGAVDDGSAGDFDIECHVNVSSAAVCLLLLFYVGRVVSHGQRSSASRSRMLPPIQSAQ